MPDFRYKPAIPSAPRGAELLSGFVQQISMHDGRKTIATARWHAPPGQTGVVQLLDLIVDPSLRRGGHGSALLRETIAQAAAYHKSNGLRFRRMWMSVEQKSQVIARAFLTQHGFHHVATIGELLKKQDALVYMKAFE